MADDLVDFLDSKSLIGFQLDASHLHNVLHTILRNQQASSQTISQLSRRLQAIEGVVGDVQERQVALEGLVAKSGNSSEELRSIRTHLQDLSAVVDNISRQAIPEVRRSCDELRRYVTPLERTIQQLAQSVPAIEATNAQLAQHVDDLSKDVQNTQRQISIQLNSVQQAGEDRERDRQAETSRISEVIRDLVVRSDRVERAIGPNAAQWRDFYEELNNRSNENFRQVEISAKAVDGELQRIRTDIANMRTELNALDNNSRQKMVKVTEDMDSKFEMVLNLLQNYERSSSELEQHLAAAGRALAASRDPVTNGPRSTTTTTSALRGGAILSDVRRNMAGDLSDPRRAW